MLCKVIYPITVSTHLWALAGIIIKNKNKSKDQNIKSKLVRRSNEHTLCGLD